MDERWLAVHDAVDIRNLHAGEDNDEELLYTLNEPWWALEEYELRGNYRPLQTFGFHPGLRGHVF
ncbi:hypothetical protein [Nesterenkonia jeotgali]|uniref:hypothetical protein n=1 Tax=Nesterenkonia jeotgali TaxID=317018 RepID=UPI0012ED0DBF|nr:hypothetical protein [Nesterenkonia jeotgali]